MVVFLETLLSELLCMQVSLRRQRVFGLLLPACLPLDQSSQQSSAPKKIRIVQRRKAILSQCDLLGDRTRADTM